MISFSLSIILNDKLNYNKHKYLSLSEDMNSLMGVIIFGY